MTRVTQQDSGSPFPFCTQCHYCGPSIEQLHLLEESMSQVPGTAQAQNVVEDVQDLLEDVSIDGMCGVY